jgi:YqaJ-like viral recombinase domain
MDTQDTETQRGSNPSLDAAGFSVPSEDGFATCLATASRGASGRARCRGSSRGRPRGRGRARGSISSAHGAITKGWSMKSVRESLVEEKQFVAEQFSERARLFCSYGFERLEEELRCRELPGSRAGIIELFMGEALSLCRQWLNEKLVRDGAVGSRVTESDMLRYVAVLILSHCTGFSLTRSIDILVQENVSAISLDKVRFISTGILAFSPSGRGDQGHSTWSCSRDHTQSLSEFEKAAFRTSCRLFLTPNHTYATLDDDLYGTRASDNQVKSLSSRKADREGHCADALADALFRITFFVRFRRRGRTQSDNVNQLLSSILESRGEQSFHGFTITADRGYAKMSLVKQLLKYDLGVVLIMPEHLVACHPFVGKSYLRVGRDDSESDEGEVGAENGATSDVGDDEVEGSERLAGMQPSVQLDRGRAFVLDDDPSSGPASFFCTKSFQNCGASSRAQVTAAAVREHGTVKFSKILRFMYRVPSNVSRAVETWIAVPGAGLGHSALFIKRDDNGRIITPAPDSPDCKDVVEREILRNCVVLTVGQRCADWFVLRQFRVTGTNAGRFLMEDENVRTELGYSPRHIATVGEGMESLARSTTEKMQALVSSWFSTARSTEAMMRGSRNEPSVMNALERKDFVKCLFEVGMIAKKGKSWMACSPDGIAVIDLNKIPEFNSNEQSLSELQLPWTRIPEFNVLPGIDGRCVLCSVEIKTSVAASSLERSIELASVDVKVCRVGDSSFRSFVPEAHIGQILHQMLVLHVSHVVYVAASETGVMFIIIAYCDISTLSLCELALEQAAGECVDWAYEDFLDMPLDNDSDLNKLLKSRLPFWKLVNSYVLEKGPFYPPLKLFRHGVQTLYSKTKGGVDGSAQARSILRSATSSLKWEQKVVTQTIKTLAVNSFVAWRMRQKRSLLESKESFQNVEYYRGCLNAVQSLADFVLDASKELAQRADTLERDRRDEVDSNERGRLNSVEVSDDEALRLRAEARLKKRYRLSFFNSADGIKLRFSVTGHDTRQADYERYCALCGSSGNTKGWRGHRSSFQCPCCDVHLCIRLHPGFRKNCWTIWHTQRRLEHRVTTSTRSDTETNPSPDSRVGDGGTSAQNRSQGAVRTR